MNEFEYTWGEYDVECTVDYTYDPVEPDQWYDQNGDPGTPGYGPTAEIHAVWTVFKDKSGKDVYVDIIDLVDTDDIESEILESYE